MKLSSHEPSIWDYGLGVWDLLNGEPSLELRGAPNQKAGKYLQ